jgi:hypothetical protein
MKILAIGDIHGKDNWEKIKHLVEEYDKFIFIGDYFDSFTIKPIDQLDNFNKIVDFKKQYSDKVELLIGNHDYHYFPSITEEYSGFKPTMKFDYQNALREAYNSGLMNVCYKHEIYLFSHAGLTKTWSISRDINLNNVVESVNDLFKHKPQEFGFEIGRNHSYYGDDVTQGPFWVRPNSLYKDALDFYIHVVGHTSYRKIEEYSHNIIVIDCLDKINQYLSIDETGYKVVDF